MSAPIFWPAGDLCEINVKYLLAVVFLPFFKLNVLIYKLLTFIGIALIYRS